MKTRTTQLTWKPSGSFSMEPIRELACGFLRGTRQCATGDRVRLAFPSDDGFQLTGALVGFREGRVEATVTGSADATKVKAQLGRVLGLDQDGVAFEKVLAGDPALAKIAERRPGFRPVVAYSPWAMGGWAVLSQRTRMNVAAAWQVRISEACGDVVELEDEKVASFPRPLSILSRGGFERIPPEKWQRLQALARAALEGELEIDRLTAMDYAEARGRLMEIPGVGPWTADAILIRGCGPADVLPLMEPTLHGAVAEAYGLTGTPSDDEVERIAEAWKPFRTWVSVMLISDNFAAARARSNGVRGGRSRSRRSEARA